MAVGKWERSARGDILKKNVKTPYLKNKNQGLTESAKFWLMKSIGRNPPSNRIAFPREEYFLHDYGT